MPLIDLGKRGWATRGCPNVLVPTLAAPMAIPLTASWGWPASYTQIVASLTYPLLLCQLQAQTCLAAVLAGANGSSSFEELIQIDVAKGAAASEVSIGVVINAASGIIIVSGWVDDASSATSATTCGRELLFGPVVIPASTRIAARGSRSTATTLAVASTLVYLDGYNLTSLDFANAHFLDDLYTRGLRNDYPKPLVAVGSTQVTASTVWALPANFTEVVAALDADYLIRAVAIQPSQAGATKSAQVEVALGAAGSEVVQARAAYLGAPAISYRATSHIQLRFPFVAYKGERSAIRVASALASGVYNVMIFGERLT